MNQQPSFPGASVWHATLFRLIATTLCLDAIQATALLAEHERMVSAARDAGIQPEGVVMAMLALDNVHGEQTRPQLSMELVSGGADPVDRATVEVESMHFASAVVKLLDARTVLANAGVEHIDVSCDLPVQRLIGADGEVVDLGTVRCMLFNSHIILKAELAEGSFSSWQIETGAVLAMAQAPRGAQFRWSESEALQALSAGAQVALLPAVVEVRHLRELWLFEAIKAAPAYRINGQLADASVMVGETLIATTVEATTEKRYQFRDQPIGLVGQDGTYAATAADGQVVAVMFDSAI